MATAFVNGPGICQFPTCERPIVSVENPFCSIHCEGGYAHNARVPPRPPAVPEDTPTQRLQRLGYFYEGSSGDYTVEGHWSTKLDHELVHLRAGWGSSEDFWIPAPGGSDREFLVCLKVACGALLVRPRPEQEVRSLTASEDAIKYAFHGLITATVGKVTCPACRVKCDEMLEQVIYIQRVVPEPK